MKLNKQLLQINRNFIICFIASASLSAVAAQLLADYENYQNTTITIIIGYVIYFGLFSSLFYILLGISSILDYFLVCFTWIIEKDTKPWNPN